MLGNYEFYYAMGLFSKISKHIFLTENTPIDLKEEAIPVLKNYETSDEREKYLIKLILQYQPKEEKDEQMLTLFEMGRNENNAWIE